MISVRCHCHRRLAMFDPLGPSILFDASAPKKIRRGSVADANAAAARRTTGRGHEPKPLPKHFGRQEVTLLLGDDGTVRISMNRGELWPSEPLDDVRAMYTACCQDPACGTRYDIADVCRAARSAHHHGHGSTTLHKAT